MHIVLWTLASSMSLALTPLASALVASLNCESMDGKWHAHDRNSIEMNRGCREEFHAGGDNLPPGRSDRYGDAPVLAVFDQGVRDHPVAPPEHHRGVDPRTHDDGSDTTGRGMRNGRNFSCASTGSDVTWCRQAVDQRNEVEIRRQLSRTACTYGHSWGIDRSDVWVSHGCRAEFVIY
jgi:hypothetical protein